MSSPAPATTTSPSWPPRFLLGSRNRLCEKLDSLMDIGDRVELHSKFTDKWVAGFEVAAVVDGGYQVRRLSDGRLLPEPTGPADIRLLSNPPDRRRPTGT